MVVGTIGSSLVNGVLNALCESIHSGKRCGSEQELFASVVATFDSSEMQCIVAYIGSESQVFV